MPFELPESGELLTSVLPEQLTQLHVLAHGAGHISGREKARLIKGHPCTSNDVENQRQAFDEESFQVAARWTGALYEQVRYVVDEDECLPAERFTQPE
ncbi:hypothetical protein D3C76_1644240 [compost metagenome]